MALTRPRFAQINTNVSEITDPISVLNKGSTASNVDIGLIMNRNNGASSNVALYWSESSNTFVTAWTTSSGTTNSNVSVSTYANLRVGTLTSDASSLTTVVITDNTNTTGLGTGAFIVSAGGASIFKDLYVGGNIYVSNIISQSTSILTVNEPLVYLSAEGIGTYNYEIGLFSHFISGTGYQHTGLVRNHVNNQWYFFSNLAEPTGGTVDLANTAIIYDTVRAGGLVLANTDPATTTTTGALTVAGGAGIAGNIYGGGSLVINGTNVLANVGSIVNSVNTTQANLGAYQIYANANIGTISNKVTTLDANVGAFHIYANANLGTATTNITTLFSNAATQQTQINSLVTNANANVAAYLLTSSGNISGAIVGSTYYGSINIGTTAFDLHRASATQTLTGVNIDGSSAKSGIVANTSAGTAYVTFTEATSGDHVINATTSLTFNPATGVLTPYKVSINSGTDSTSTTTGALTITGGAGVSGNVYSGAVYTSGLYWAGNNVSITGPAGGVNGSITYNNSGSQAGTNILYDSITGNVVFTDTTDTTSATTGAVVLKGGIGIAGNAFVGNVLASGFFYANGTPFTSSNYGNTQVAAYLLTSTGNISSGNIAVTGGTTSTSNVSGALVVSGGVGVGGNIYIGNRVGYVWGANNVSAAYQVFNPVTNSIDTYFG